MISSDSQRVCQGSVKVMFFKVALFLQGHLKDAGKEKTEAQAFRQVVRASGHYQPAPVSHKRSKLVDSVFGGKRVLDLVTARAMIPPGAYLYETVDGTRIRIFYGRMRKSTSSRIAIGKAQAVLNCLRWG